MFTGSTQAPRLVARFGVRMTLVGGMVVATAGLMRLTRTASGRDYFVEVLPGMVMAGLGMGITLVSGTVAAMQGVAPAQSGLASGLLNTSRLVGGALGLATLATIADAPHPAGAGVAQRRQDGLAGVPGRWPVHPRGRGRRR